jgi:hypothetical protein
MIVLEKPFHWNVFYLFVCLFYYYHYFYFLSSVLLKPQTMHLKIVYLSLSFASIFFPQQGQFISLKWNKDIKIIWVNKYYLGIVYSHILILLLKYIQNSYCYFN